MQIAHTRGDEVHLWDANVKGRAGASGQHSTSLQFVSSRPLEESELEMLAVKLRRGEGGMANLSEAAARSLVQYKKLLLKPLDEGVSSETLIKAAPLIALPRHPPQHLAQSGALQGLPPHVPPQGSFGGPVGDGPFGGAGNGVAGMPPAGMPWSWPGVQSMPVPMQGAGGMSGLSMTMQPVPMQGAGGMGGVSMPMQIPISHQMMAQMQPVTFEQAQQMAQQMQAQQQPMQPTRSLVHAQPVNPFLAMPPQAEAPVQAEVQAEPFGQVEAPILAGPVEAPPPPGQIEAPVPAGQTEAPVQDELQAEPAGQAEAPILAGPAEGPAPPVQVETPVPSGQAETPLPAGQAEAPVPPGQAEAPAQAGITDTVAAIAAAVADGAVADAFGGEDPVVAPQSNEELPVPTAVPT